MMEKGKEGEKKLKKEEKGGKREKISIRGRIMKKSAI